jgi:clan AA aspartic protease
MEMGTVKAEITLKNVHDMAYAAIGSISAADVHTVTVQAMVDTGSMGLIINEEMRERLGLGLTDRKAVRVADGRRVECVVTEPVDIYWKNRSVIEKAIVIPGAPEVLLGVRPLEGLDLMVDPVNLKLVGVHGDEWTELVPYNSQI